MTERDLPEPEDFAALVVEAMAIGGRKWTWLAEQTGLHVNTIRYQIITNPASLKLRTSRRIATALGINQWGEAA